LGVEGFSGADHEVQGDGGGGEKRDAFGEVGAVVFDHNGLHGGSRAGGNHGEAVLEAVQRRSERAGAFRKNEQVSAPADFFDSLPDKSRTGIVRHIARQQGTSAQHRIAQQRCPHHAGCRGEVGGKEDRIEQGGVVRDDHRAAQGADFFQSPDVQAEHAREAHPAGEKTEEKLEEVLSGGGGDVIARGLVEEPAHGGHGGPDGKKERRGGELTDVGDEAERGPPVVASDRFRRGGVRSEGCHG